MNKLYKKLDSKSILKEIRKSIDILNCIDITDEFEYEDVFIYDCMVETLRVKCLVQDSSGIVSYTNLRDFPLFEDDLQLFVGDMINSLETEIKLKYSIDNLKLDYEIYTFFDYKDSIKFILIFDFSGHERRYLRRKRQNILNAQLGGRSKYLN